VGSSDMTRLAALLHLANDIETVETRVAAILESQLDVGDPCWVEVQGQRLSGNVRAVTFTAGKVRYAVQVEDNGGPTTLHNLDSVLVGPREGGPKLDYFHDNYSSDRSALVDLANAVSVVEAKTGAGEAWKKAKTECYVLSQDGFYLQRDGTWGPKAGRRVFQTWQEANDARASSTGNHYHADVFRVKDDKNPDPRNKGNLAENAKSWAIA